MPIIKFRPHSVVTYCNGSREAIAVDFTPTISFNFDEFKHEADLLGATYFIVQLFGESLEVRNQFIYWFDEDLCQYRIVECWVLPRR